MYFACTLQWCELVVAADGSTASRYWLKEHGKRMYRQQIGTLDYRTCLADIDAFREERKVAAPAREATASGMHGPGTPTYSSVEIYRTVYNEAGGESSETPRHWRCDVVVGTRATLVRHNVVTCSRVVYVCVVVPVCMPGPGCVSCHRGAAT